MLEVIFGSAIKERILLFLYTRKEGHIREMAKVFAGYPTAFQRQIKTLEKGGVLVGRLKGRTRLYSFNPRYPFKAELEKLLDRALAFVPKNEK